MNKMRDSSDEINDDDDDDVTTDGYGCSSFSGHVFKMNEINSDPKSNKTSKIIRILSYNIFMRPSLVPSNNMSDHKDKRLSLFCSNEIRKWDIIILQEMFGSFSSRRNSLLLHAHREGFKYAVASPDPPLFSSKMIDGGLVTLSRYKISRSQYLTFSNRNQSDQFAAKGILYTKILVPPSLSDCEDDGSADSFLHLFNIHAQASYFDHKGTGKEDRNKVIRAFQMKETRDFIYSLTNLDSHPIIVGGDFNVNGRASSSDDTDSLEYLQLINTLSTPYFEVRDLLREHNNGCHPVTMSDVTFHPDGSVTPKEISLTSTDDQGLCLRLDYIFWLTRTKTKDSPDSLPSKTQNEECLEWQPVPGSCEIVPHFVSKLYRFPFRQLSDHYGVCISLEKPP